mmetsp:Transcript_8652/g.30563  ORF Transcript_8652/g.30563 Transcript_8652/m.30563 type:complete len:397 (+) Transcript_8652:345-1535(+)
MLDVLLGQVQSAPRPRRVAALWRMAAKPPRHVVVALVQEQGQRLVAREFEELAPLFFRGTFFRVWIVLVKVLLLLQRPLPKGALARVEALVQVDGRETLFVKGLVIVSRDAPPDGLSRHVDQSDAFRVRIADVDVIDVPLRDEAAKVAKVRDTGEIRLLICRSQKPVLRQVRRPPSHVRLRKAVLVHCRGVQLARHPCHDRCGPGLRDAVVEHAARVSRRAIRVPRRHKTQRRRALEGQPLRPRQRLLRRRRLWRRNGRLSRRVQKRRHASLVRPVLGPLADGRAVGGRIDGRLWAAFLFHGEAAAGDGPVERASGPGLQEVAHFRPRLGSVHHLEDVVQKDEAVRLAAGREESNDFGVASVVRLDEAPPEARSDAALGVRLGRGAGEKGRLEGRL